MQVNSRSYRKNSTDSNYRQSHQEDTINTFGQKTVPKIQKETEIQQFGKHAEKPYETIYQRVESIKSQQDLEDDSSQNNESQYKISSEISEQASEFSRVSQNKFGYRNPTRKSKKKKIIPRSVHHNSQKHAVVTLKLMVQFPYEGSQSKAHQIAKKIWTKFQQTKRKNKGLLNVLFGVRDDKEQQIQKLLNQYNFKEVLPYPYAQIKQAQNILREIVINQVNSETISKNLKFRRIQNKKQFREYMINLVNQFKEGPLRRRILKEASNKISQYAEMDKYLNQESFQELQF